MKCKKCGNELKGDSLFCYKCGEKLEKRGDFISRESLNQKNRLLKIVILCLSISVIMAILIIAVIVIKGNQYSKQIATEEITEYVKEERTKVSAKVNTEASTEEKEIEETTTESTKSINETQENKNTSTATEHYKEEDYSTVYWPTQINHIKEVYKYTVDNQDFYSKTARSDEQYYEVTQGNVVKAVIKNNQDLNKTFGGNVVVEYYYENPDYDGKTGTLLFAFVTVDNNMEYRYYFYENYIIRYIKGKVGSQKQYDFEYETPESCPVTKTAKIVYQTGKSTYYENAVEIQSTSDNEGDTSTWDMKEDIQYIRNVYAYTNKYLSQYEKVESIDDYINYILEYRALVKSVIKNNETLEDVFHGNVVVEYYYGNPDYDGSDFNKNRLIFAFLTVDKKKEYRYYFKEGKVIRYIGPDHVEHDFTGGKEPYDDLGMGISEVYSRGQIEPHYNFT